MHPNPVLRRYLTYIKSKYWKRRKDKYFKRHPRRCAVCKTEANVALHHVTYGNYSQERDEDLIAFCYRHHNAFHEQFETKRDMKEETAFFVQAASFHEEVAAHLRNL